MSKSPDLEKISSNLYFDESHDEKEDIVAFRANAGPQTEFLSSSEQEVLYGGAAGGGKSYAILADSMYYFGHPQFRGLIVRRTTEELRELIDKSHELFPKAHPKSRWWHTAQEWRHPNGGKLWMSYLEKDSDVNRYQGQAFNYIAFDELTQWPTSYAWDYMRSRLRSASPDLPLYQRATSNPGGVGHHWVKKMFIDPAPWGQAFWGTDIETSEILRYPKNHEKAGKPLLKRRFIPAKLSDNPYLYSDGRYEANLLSLPEYERKRLLEGDWDAISGAAFPEWDRRIHVIEPFDIPDGWKKFRSADYGYSAPAACLWFTVAPSGQLIVYRELYGKGMLAKDFGLKVRELEQYDGRIAYGMMDSSTWHKRGDIGPPIALQASVPGVTWRPSDRSKGSRVAGLNEIHRRLQIDEWTEEPGLVFFNTCINTIAQIPVLPMDKDNIEDVDTDAEDHIYDALRYGCMSRPRPSNYSSQDRIPYRPADQEFGY
jgi:hypothetical protein